MSVVKEIKTTKTKRARPGSKVGSEQANTAATINTSDHKYLTEADTTITGKSLSVYPEAVPDEDAAGFIGLGYSSTYPHVV